VGNCKVYEYLFAKDNQSNIDDDDLTRLRKLVKGYALLGSPQLMSLLKDKDWLEICHEAKVQE